MRASRGWLVVAALLVGAGGLLRWWHLGTFSLWWDELIEIRMADLPSAWDVVTRVRLGVPPGSGNAGAVPLDYVLLWAWLRHVPMPAPERLETYFRFPSFVWSCALPPLAGWWTWRRVGTAAGLATLALVAGAVPLALYAAEARFYSLFCLLVVLNLATFAAVVRAPERRGAWLGYGLGAVLLFLGGLYGLLILGCQVAWLALLLRSRAGAGRRAFAALGAVAVVLAVVVALYFADTNLASKSVRGPSRLPWWPNLLVTLQFFGTGSTALPWVLGLAPPVALLVAWRRHRPLLPVIACTTLVVAIAVPVILSIAEAKEHFFHPRHAVFLLPLLLILLGIAIGGIAETLAPRRLAVPLALAAAVALVAPTDARYLRGPWPFFNQTKMLHDFRGVTQILRARTAGYGPDDRYLLAATRGRGGHLGNPVLAWYLEWYGIRDRVILRGTTRPAATLAKVRRECQRRCRNFSGGVERDLGLVKPHQQTRAKLRLLGDPVRVGAPPGRPRNIGFLIYPPLDRWKLRSLAGYRAWRLSGVHLYELIRPDRP